MFAFSYPILYMQEAKPYDGNNGKHDSRPPGVSGIVIVNSEGVPIRSTLESRHTLQYSALISQLAAKALGGTKSAPSFGDAVWVHEL